MEEPRGDPFCPRPISLPLPKSLVRLCERRAKSFCPCVCDYLSSSDAIVDVYGINQSQETLHLLSSVNQVFTAVDTVGMPGTWIVSPPKKLRPQKTFFARAYSGKVSTSDPKICIYDVNYFVSLTYGTSRRAPSSTVSFEVEKIRPTDDLPFNPETGTVTCQPIPFDPVSTPFLHAAGKLEILNLQSSQRPPWINTVLFLIVDSCPS